MFVFELTNALGNINVTDLTSIESLKNTVQEYARISNSSWHKFSKNVDITKYSKAQQNNKCSVKLNTYCFSKSLDDWKEFKRTVKNTKHTFFNDKIQEIASKNKRSQKLINWIEKCKLLATQVLQYNRQPCIELKDLQQALYQTFNSAQNWQVNI